MARAVDQTQTPAEQGILFDAQGKAFRVGAYGDTSWNASSFGPEHKGWNPGNGSPDSDNLHETDIQAGRGRDLARNEPVAGAATSALDHNVVGTGLRLRANPDYRALGWTKKKAMAWARQTTARFRSWFESTDVDATRTDTGGVVTSIAFVAALTSGAAIVLPEFDPDTAQGRYGTCLRILERDYVCQPTGEPEHALFRGGMEFNARGMVTAWHLRSHHPGDDFLMGTTAIPSWTRVPAFTDWGRRNLIYLASKQRPGENFSAPILAAFMPEFKTLSDYKKAELTATMNNALVAAMFESNMPFDKVQKLFRSRDEYLNYRARAQQGLRAGATIQVPLGDKLSAFLPGRPNPNFAAFVEAVLRHGLASVGLPYESVLRDFSKTNYSSARASLLEAWRAYNVWRQWLADRFMRPVWELWLEEACHLGDLDLDGEVIDIDFLFDNWAALSRVKVIGAARGWIDETKEVAAAGERMRLRLSTYEDECGAQGKDWEENLDQIEEEVEAFHARGLLHPSEMPAAGAPPAGAENPRAVMGNNGGPDLDEDADPEDEPPPRGRAPAPTFEDA